MNSADTTAILIASGYKADLDVNMDGSVDSLDSSMVSGLTGRTLSSGQLSDRGNIVGWCGYLYEEATGMWLARHRWQIPELGRWANRDPIGYAGGGQNLYEYVNGNPVFLQDAFGLHGQAFYDLVREKVIDRAMGVIDSMPYRVSIDGTVREIKINGVWFNAKCFKDTVYDFMNKVDAVRRSIDDLQAQIDRLEGELLRIRRDFEDTIKRIQNTYKYIEPMTLTSMAMSAVAGGAIGSMKLGLMTKGHPVGFAAGMFIGFFVGAAIPVSQHLALKKFLKEAEMEAYAAARAVRDAAESEVNAQIDKLKERLWDAKNDIFKAVAEVGRAAIRNAMANCACPFNEDGTQQTLQYPGPLPNGMDIERYDKEHYYVPGVRLPY